MILSVPTKINSLKLSLYAESVLSNINNIFTDICHGNMNCKNLKHFK